MKYSQQKRTYQKNMATMEMKIVTLYLKIVKRNNLKYKLSKNDVNQM